jgi:Fe-S-cluster containining protein
MKLTIEIPEWAKDRVIVIMAGIEHLATKEPNENFIRYKTVRCNRCGKCCMRLFNHTFPMPVIDGRCVHLVKASGIEEIYECGLGPMRPFLCSMSDPVGEDFCCIEHKEIPLED